MDVHVWRVSTIFGVMACSTLLLFAAAVVGSAIARRRQSMSIRVATGVTLVLMAAAACIALRATALSIARSFEVSVTYVDPGPLGYFAPPLFAVFAFLVGRRMLQESWTGRRALLFYAWLLAFTAANVVNLCSPGWCLTVGFPLPWNHVSDHILEFGDNHLARIDKIVTTGAKVVGAIADLIAFVVVAGVLTRPRPPGQLA